MEMTDLDQIALQDEIDKEILNTSTDDIVNRTRLLENDIKVRFSAFPELFALMLTVCQGDEV